MSTGLFADEEDGYNLEQDLDETKFVLKGDKPSTAPPIDAIEDEDGEELPDDLEGLEDAPSDDNPFDDEPFDAGIEADEDTDPTKYIQQLSGKLGQSLRQYTDDEGQPDFNLEKFAVNSVLSATHTGEMDNEDQRDIINQVKSAGEGEDSDIDGEDVDGEDGDDVDIDVDVDSGAPQGDEELEEIVEELPLNKDGIPFDGGLGGCDKEKPMRDDALDALKIIAKVKESKLNEGKWAKIMSGVRKNPQGPFAVVAIEGGRVIDQEISITNPQLIPARYEGMKRKHPMARISIENGEGLSIYNEGRLKESKNNRIFVDKTKLVKHLRLMENEEPIVEPKPITKPATKPARPMRETERPFSPRPRKTEVQPDPKAEDNDIITDSE